MIEALVNTEKVDAAEGRADLEVRLQFARQRNT
jgi:hypothetical protein